MLGIGLQCKRCSASFHVQCSNVEEGIRVAKSKGWLQVTYNWLSKLFGKRDHWLCNRCKMFEN